MKVRCGNFEGEILSLEASSADLYFWGRRSMKIPFYDLKFVQETGEIIEICNIRPSDFEIVK